MPEVYGNSGIGNLVASAFVLVTGGVPSLPLQPLGVINVTTAGAGLYTVTLGLNSQIAPDNAAIVASVELTARSIAVQHVNEREINVFTFNAPAGAGAHSSFYLTVFRKGLS